jgi:antitoxin HicB
VGSSFDESLRTEGLYEGVTTLAWKRVLSWEVSEAMRKGHISKSEMAKRMGTSPGRLERLLDLTIHTSCSRPSRRLRPPWVSASQVD